MMLEIKTTGRIIEITKDICTCGYCNEPELQKKWVSVESLYEVINKIEDSKQKHWKELIILKAMLEKDEQK